MISTPMIIKTITFAAAFSVITLSPSLVKADRTSFSETIVEEYYSHFQKPGFLVDDLMQFYADDVVFTDPTFEVVAEGKSDVRKLYADLGTSQTAYENIQWTITDVVSAGDIIVIRGRWSGRFHDCEFEIDFMTLWRMADGKIAEQNDFFAASSFDRQVGWNGQTATCNSE